MNLHMLRAVLEMTEKKSAMYFSYFQLQKKKKKKKEHILFCAVQVVQKTLLGKTVSLWQSTVTETWYTRRPFYSMATVLLFQRNSGYDLVKL